jgi:ABC-type multidrug transport system fused ATPase/permease subunit
VRFLSGVLNILDQKERARLFLLVFLDIVVSALDIAFLAFSVLVINFYIKNAGLPYLSFLPKQLADQNSVLLISLFFILFGIKNAVAYWISSRQFSFIYSVASRLSKRNIRRYLREDYLNYINVDSSVNIYKISQQPIEFSTYILTNLQQVISQSVLVLFSVTAILWYNATLFLLLLLLLMPAVAIIGWVLKKRLKHIRKNIKRASADTLKNLREALASYIESNIYSKDDFFTERYYVQQEQLNNNIRVQQTLQGLPSRLIEVFAIFGLFILILINKWSGHNAAIDLLTVGIFMAAAYKIIPGAVKILNSAGQMKTYEFTLNDLAIADNNEKQAIRKENETIRSVSFEKVWFKYKDQPVLTGISAELLPRDFAGISADSGRGKTTLISILLGFIEQQEGTVSINNKIVTAEERKGYWNRISYIKQQSFLIHDTLAKNITLSDECDMPKLNEVIFFCGLDSMLNLYTEGINLAITENGKNLSGGQRQRIALARALYHGFDMLILDEPFGEMDQKSENIILKKLQLLANQGKIILFITHNRTSILFCNKLIAIDGQR